jgi:anti-sigma B factor antagonist
MTMRISEREVGQVTVIDLKSEANLRGQYEGFQQIVRKRMEAGRRHFVVNLAECHWIDSAGLGELIRSFAHVMRQGGDLKLAGATQKVKNILSVTNLNQVFEVFDDEDSAIKSF